MNPYRDSHCLEDKRLLALEREQDRLHKENRALEPLPVAVPYQSGWLRYYVLTDRARQRPDAAALETILREINVVVHFSRHPDAVRLRRRRGRYWKSLFEHHQLRLMCLGQFGRLRWPKEWQSYFESLPRFVHPALGCRFAKADLFRFEVVPRIITHVKQLCPRIERRLAEIDKEFTSDRWGRLCKLRSYRCRWRVHVKAFDQQRADEHYRLQMAELRSEGVIPQAVRPAGFHGLRDHVTHFGPQALKGCSALLTRRAGSITLEVHFFGD